MRLRNSGKEDVGYGTMNKVKDKMRKVK